MQYLLLNIILLVRLYCEFKKQPLKPTEHLPIFVTGMLATKTLLIAGQNLTQDCSVCYNILHSHTSEKHCYVAMHCLNNTTTRGWLLG